MEIYCYKIGYDRHLKKEILSGFVEKDKTYRRNHGSHAVVYKCNIGRVISERYSNLSSQVYLLKENDSHAKELLINHFQEVIKSEKEKYERIQKIFFEIIDELQQ